MYSKSSSKNKYSILKAEKKVTSRKEMFCRALNTKGPCKLHGKCSLVRINFTTKFCRLSIIAAEEIPFSLSTYLEVGYLDIVPN